LIDPESLQVGDIIFVDLYDITGNEHGDTRPAIIMAIHPETKLFMVILLTSKDVSRFRFTLLIKTKKSNGLRNDSYAMTFQTRAIAFKRIKERIRK
jgi:PemK-like protein.